MSEQERVEVQVQAVCIGLGISQLLWGEEGLRPALFFLEDMCDKFLNLQTTARVATVMTEEAARLQLTFFSLVRR